jgi:DNA-directed RNA polymerase subunit omega
MSKWMSQSPIRSVTFRLAETTEEVVVEDDQPEGVSFASMSEEELLAGIEGLVPPEKSDDY